MAQNRTLSLGGIGSPCCCGGCAPIKFCLTNACGGGPCSNVTVTVGSVSGTTDSTGCVTLSGLSAGTSTVTTSGNPRYTDTSGAYTLVCGGTLTISDIPTGSGYNCSGCFVEPIPSTLHYNFDGVTGTITGVSPGTDTVFLVGKSGSSLIGYGGLSVAIASRQTPARKRPERPRLNSCCISRLTDRGSVAT